MLAEVLQLWALQRWFANALIGISTENVRIAWHGQDICEPDGSLQAVSRSIYATYSTRFTVR